MPEGCAVPQNIHIHDEDVIASVDIFWEEDIGPGLQQLTEREPHGFRADSRLFLSN
jgi:hypothetical protein